MRVFIRKFSWYYNKHGLLILIARGFRNRLWRRFINSREVVFVAELQNLNTIKYSCPDNLIVEPYNVVKDIPQKLIKQLLDIECEEILFPFLEKNFRLGATFWLGRIDNKVVGYQWSLIGGFNGFYSLPVKPDEAIIFSTQIFPEVRGKQINPALTEMIFKKLKHIGLTRVYIKVNVWNKANLRSLSKTNCRSLGTVRTIKLFNKYITIWDKKSITI